ncbi:hypothetical protein ABLE92_01140 [Gordonia sp. VNQ95]|jgi:hypothetical protein|uniref:hypothetical protein n=1 Tax=Gordonia TaxID=2053 RepID=UPI0032B3379C
MVREPETLAVLRDRAVAGVEDLVTVLGVGRTIGVTVPADDDVRTTLREVGTLDLTRLSADAHRLQTVHRVVADLWHRLPEQQVRLDHAWSSGAGAVAMTLAVDHQRRAEADLQALRSVADATAAAASGIDQVLRTWYLTVARLSTPLIAGVPPGELPAAVLSGRVPLTVVAADIGARVHLLHTTADSTRTGISAILEQLATSAGSWSPPSNVRAESGLAGAGGGYGPGDDSGMAAESTGDVVHGVSTGVGTGADASAVGHPSTKDNAADVPLTLTAQKSDVVVPDETSGEATDSGVISKSGQPGHALGGHAPMPPPPAPSPSPSLPESDLALAGDQ